jgi:hypothetical protein
MIMKKTKILLLILFLLLPGHTLLRAQSEDEVFFRQEAAGASILYRGHQAYGYSIHFNGYYWWTAPEFLTGDVFYNGKVYHGLELNVDASRQELLVRHLVGQGSKVLSREFVDWFTLDGRRFVNLQALCGPEAPSGYWEVLFDGKTLFLRQITKTLLSDHNGAKRQMIGAGEPYDLRIHETFVRDVAYCLLTEAGQLVPVRSKSQIRNQFPDQRKDIRRHIVSLEKRFDRSMTLEEYGMEVLKYVESR